MRRHAPVAAATAVAALAVVLAVATALVPARLGSGVPRATDRATATLLVTSADDGGPRLATRAPGPAAPDLPAEAVVLHPDRAAQTWRGTGAALTDASVAVLRDRPDLVRLLVDPGAERGARLSWLRLPLTATDMSTSTWGWRFDGRRARPGPEARQVLRFLRTEVLPLAPDLQLVASPWSAPPRFKTGHAWAGSDLRPDRVRRYGRMLVSQARWLVGHGFPLAALTPLNEPGHASTYPTTTADDASLARLAAYVGPRLDRLGVDLWGLDHNWADRPRLDTQGLDGLDAAAFHCYRGTPAQAADLPLPWLVTECTGTTDGALGTFGWDARTLVRDATATGSEGLLLWNLALPPGFRGPLGGCADCRGLLTVTADRHWAGPEYYVLAHLARAAPPGSRVVPVDAPGDLVVTGFAGPDGLGALVWNGTDRTRWLRVGTPGQPGGVVEVRAHELATWRSTGG